MTTPNSVSIAVSASVPDDVIDRLVGSPPGAASNTIQTVRANRSQARLHAQQSYRALFDPALLASGEPSLFTLAERFAVATFVALLHGEGSLIDFYAACLSQTNAPAGLLQVMTDEAATGAGPGPYGRFPTGVLSIEDVPGPVYRVSPRHTPVLGARLSAAFEHAHLLVLHPRDAAARDLQALLDADWSTTEIVTLSQMVAFLAFQVRVVVGLRVLSDRITS